MMHTTENQSFAFQLDSRSISIGRDPACDIELQAVGVSRRHAELTLLPEGPRIRDLGSSFGIRVNRKPITEAVLEHENDITIGVVTFTVHIGSDKLYLTRKMDFTVSEDVPELQDTEKITIGRDSGNTIHLTHPLVSRFHCTITKAEDGSYSIVDHGSTNGTFVNGSTVHHAKCGESDVIQIGPFRFMFADEKFIQADDSQQIKLEAHGITVKRDGKTLLDRVTLSIQPGEFVAILGPSGAGKTTLAKALTAQIPVDSGTVYYNGFPLSKFAAAFSSVVGYVSQYNLLRPELTVWETFSEQALLRLPKDSLEAERIERIREVMAMLDITQLNKRRISNLSGGEAKRVHLGIELLASPTIIFLDEPLSGLDPGLIHKFMELFKQLCKKGYTLLLTTHTLEQIELCDRLFFLNNGKLIYQGTPEETAQAMHVSSIAEAYEKVRTNSDLFQSTSAETVSVSEMHEKVKNLPSPKKTSYRRPQSAGFFRQLSMLIARYSKVLIRDLANLILILLQAPLIALLLVLVFHGDSQFLPMSFYFCLTISAIWIGGVNSVREIARERELYEREFRAGLSAAAYVTAKCIIFSMLAFLQAVLFAAGLHLGFDAFEFTAKTLLLISVTTISGTILSLAISAFSGNVNRAVSLLPIIFIPQIFFSGILIPFDRMPEVGRIISYITVSRPTFTMFKKVCLLNQPVSNLEEWLSLALLNVSLIILIGIRMRWHRFFTRPGLK